MHIRIHRILPRSLTDGPGERTVLFMQGCSIGCPGCQNQELWPARGGIERPVVEVVRELLATGRPITISGGEPFQQVEALNALLWGLRKRHTIVYSGYTWERLYTGSPLMQETLALIDVLVDGPYVSRLDHNRIQYRGSSNQRPIDVQASLRDGEPVLLDWDSPRITIAQDGTLSGAIGVMAQLADLGPALPSRRCGEVVGVRDE